MTPRRMSSIAPKAMSVSYCSLAGLESTRTRRSARQASARLPRCFRLRRGDNERHASGFLEQTQLLPQAMLAQVPAVIAPQDDNGVFRQAEPLKGIEQQTHLSIHKRDRRVVAADAVLLLLLIQ